LDKSRRSRSLGVGGVSPLVGAEPQDSDRAFLRAGIREGGIQIEPNVAIVCELAQHGVLVEDGSLRKGRLVVQECDARGQWLATRIATDADEVDDATRTAIANEVERVAAALHAANYFGPFGVDAFLYRARDGMRALQPRSEINARYSMGFAVGFGLRAPDA
jgi:hypothetical protein